MPKLVNGETASVLTGLSNSFGITATTPVVTGGYTLTVAGTLTNANYTVTTTNNGAWTVNPKSITVTALGGSSYVGESPSNPGLSATGLVNGETVSVLTGLSNSFGITAATPVGSYTLNVAGTLTNGNYTAGATNSGTWTVTPPPPTYAITVKPSQGGSVTADKVFAAAGETVTLSISPDAGCELYAIGVQGNIPTVYISPHGNAHTRTFTMPSCAVTVSAAFRNIGYQAAWDAALALIEKATFTLTQAEAANETAARYRLAALINALIAPTGFRISADDIVIFVFQPAVAGDATTPKGIGGLIEFRVSPPSVPPKSAYSSGFITATGFDATGNGVIAGEHAGSPLRAWAQNGVLNVSGLTVGDTWSVYNMYGILIRRTVATDSKATIPLPAHGLYIIRNGNATIKLIL